MDDGALLWSLRRAAALVGRVDIGVPCLERCDLKPWVARLDPAGRRRSDRFVHNRDRERFRFGHGLLRVMLGKAMDRAPVSFEVGAHGKPRLAGVQTHAFNVSHSGDYVMVAVAKAMGSGLSLDPLAIGIQTTPGPITASVASGYCAALAPCP